MNCIIIDSLISDCACRALMEQMSVSGIQRQTLDGLQEKLNDLETTLSRERDEHQRAIVSVYR